MRRSAEFVSGGTSGTQWDCSSLCGNVQIYQILSAVINLLGKHWVLKEKESRKGHADEVWEPQKVSREIGQKGTATRDGQHLAPDFSSWELTGCTRQKGRSRAPQPFVILIPLVAISRALTFYCNYIQLYTWSIISSEPQRNTRGRHSTMEQISAPILYNISEDSEFWNTKLVAVVVIWYILWTHGWSCFLQVECFVVLSLCAPYPLPSLRAQILIIPFNVQLKSMWSHSHLNCHKTFS